MVLAERRIALPDEIQVSEAEKKFNTTVDFFRSRLAISGDLDLDAFADPKLKIALRFFLTDEKPSELRNDAGLSRSYLHKMLHQVVNYEHETADPALQQAFPKDSLGFDKNSVLMYQNGTTSRIASILAEDPQASYDDLNVEFSAQQIFFARKYLVRYRIAVPYKEIGSKYLALLDPSIKDEDVQDLFDGIKNPKIVNDLRNMPGQPIAMVSVFANEDGYGNFRLAQTSDFYNAIVDKNIPVRNLESQYVDKKGRPQKGHYYFFATIHASRVSQAFESRSELEKYKKVNY